MKKSNLFANETFQALTSVCAIIVRTNLCDPYNMKPGMEEEVQSMEVVHMDRTLDSVDLINHMDVLGFAIGEISRSPLILIFKPKKNV